MAVDEQEEKEEKGGEWWMSEEKDGDERMRRCPRLPRLVCLQPPHRGVELGENEIRVRVGWGLSFSTTVCTLWTILDYGPG